MKTARKRAEEFTKAIAPTHLYRDAVINLERMFKEYARDQRHACAEAVLDRSFADSSYRVADAVHEAVMNAPLPGE